MFLVSSTNTKIQKNPAIDHPPNRKKKKATCLLNATSWSQFRVKCIASHGKLVVIDLDISPTKVASPKAFGFKISVAKIQIVLEIVI